MSSDRAKAPVPKFASFRPKVAAKEATEKGDPKIKSRDTKENSHSERREERRGHDEDKHRPKHKHDRNEREPKRRRDQSAEKASRPKEAGSSKALAPADAVNISKELFENESNVYRIDCKGDDDNLRYRSLHIYNVPKYKRIGYGRVLGANLDQKIDRVASDDKGLVLVAPNFEDRSSTRLLQKHRPTETRHLRLIRPGTESKDPEHTESFISLKSIRKRKRGSESPVIEPGEVDFRSVEGKAKPPETPGDSDLEYGSDSSYLGEIEVEVEQVARQRNAELSRRTRDAPQDLEGWQELIEHQRNVLGFSGKLSAEKSRTLADIRISIYEQALQKVKAPDSRATLSLGMLQEGAKFWEAKKLASKWEETLRAFSTNLTIWTAYLNFIQSSYTEFRYERSKSEYQNCLRILARSLEEAAGTPKADEISTILVYVFLRLTTFMRDAGYHELAEALWQAVLELHFFEPKDLRRRVAAFEEFWESEVPRIGEVGAKGWVNFSPDTQDYPEPMMIEVDKVENLRNIFMNFAKAEGSAAQKLAHPGRSADDAGEDDPYHIVLFNDIKPILFPHLQMLQSKADLVAAFLRFSGLPMLPWASSRAYEKWWLDPYLADLTKEVLVRHRQMTTDVLFSDGFVDIELQDPEWTRRVLQSLVDTSPDDEVLAEYFVAFDYHFFKSSAAKSAKQLLKIRSSNMRLYNYYAVIECRNKNLDAGSGIFATAIGMSNSFNDKQKRFTVLLYRTWIWETLRLNEQQKAVNILLSISDLSDLTHITRGDKDFSPSNVLRVKRWLTEGRDAMLSASKPHLATMHSELLALLAYFQHTKSLEAAFEVYKETSLLFSSRILSATPAHEHLHQAKARLISYHLAHVHIYKPSALRTVLAESIGLFPNNTILLTAYSKLESNFSIEDRIHSLLNDILTSPIATIINWFFTLHTSLQRSLEFGGTTHSVRAIFERALSGPGKHCLALWMQYLDFEIRQGEKKKVDAVFLRGLRELPWCKWWVIRGLEGLNGEEGVRVWNVLGERELRVVVDIEELVEDMGRKRVT